MTVAVDWTTSRSVGAFCLRSSAPPSLGFLSLSLSFHLFILSVMSLPLHCSSYNLISVAHAATRERREEKEAQRRQTRGQSAADDVKFVRRVHRHSPLPLFIQIYLSECLLLLCCCYFCRPIG